MLDSMEQIRQRAYLRGQQMRQWHEQQQCVVTEEALTILAADFAHLVLFHANQYLSAGTTHECAGMCEQAFREGYCSPLL